MRVLITGGAGFIGSNLVEFLNAKRPDWDLVVLDDLSSGSQENLRGLRSRFCLGSILDRELLKEAMEGISVVVHLAAIGSVPRSVAEPRPTHDANITGTFNVLEVSRDNDVELIVLASSSSVYGSNPKLPRSESDWTRPMSPYAVSKLAAEAYANAYLSSYGLPTLAFRFFNVYGPKQRGDHPYAAVVPKFIEAAIARKPLQIHGSGEQTRDFTFVETVCQAIEAACADRISHEHPVNLAHGSRTSINELAQLVRDVVGSDVQFLHEASRQGDVYGSQADSELFRSLFPAVAASDLRSGLEMTVRWFRTFGGRVG